MRTILTALLCSSLLTGGAAPAAAAVIQPHTASLTVTELTFGQSDYNAFLEEPLHGRGSTTNLIRSPNPNNP